MSSNLINKNKQNKNDGQPEPSNAAKKASLPKATKPNKPSYLSTNKNNMAKSN
jgi:hypothetical protein